MPQISPEWAALFGVVLGFVLSEFSQYIRYQHRIGRLKTIVAEELKSIRCQIDQKLDILSQAQECLGKKRILPTRSVRTLTTGYASALHELYGHLSDQERNCLHVIHEYLRISDDTMDRFETDILTAIKEKIFADPYSAYADHFSDLQINYENAKKLIDSYLEGIPIDVFHVAAAR